MIKLFCCVLVVLSFVQCTKNKVEKYKITLDYLTNTSISYSKTIQPILTNYCLPCHANPGSGGINLDAYNSVKLCAQSGQIIQAIVHDSSTIVMPPLPQQGPDSLEITKIKQWIKEGCQNN